jgi:hypothetical protein
MKVFDLTDTQLDYWVARCEKLLNGHEQLFPNERPVKGLWLRGQLYSPSTNWALGGPLIEREQISIRHIPCPIMGQIIAASIEYIPASPTDPARMGAGWWAGDTPLIAAMRAYVASKFGDEVEDI